MRPCSCRKGVLWWIWAAAILCEFTSNSVHPASLNSFIKHTNPEEEAVAKRKAEIEASTARVKAEADALAKLRIPKVALLFLTRGDMPHESAWAAWLGAARGRVPINMLDSGTCSSNRSLQQPTAPVRPAQETYKLRRRIFAEQGLFSIYVHPSPDFQGYPKDSVFYGHSVRLRVKVTWGSHSEVEAMRLLLRAALANSLNQHFVYLCETSIPLYPPAVVYQQLMLEGKSRIDACPKDDPEHPVHSLERWDEGMLPVIPRGLWRKSGQWISLTRKHADVIAQDYSIASEFEEHCHTEANEHYFGVVLAANELEQETTCVSNSMSSLWPWQHGDLSHPVTFQADQITPELILERRHNRVDWTAESSPCKDDEAIRLARGAFVHVGPSWEVGCHWKAQSAYNDTLLAGSSCALFARKMSIHAKVQVEDVITSCDARLQIAPQSTCSEEQKASSGWIFG